MLQKRHLRFAVAFIVVAIAIRPRIPAQDAVGRGAEVRIGIEIVRGRGPREGHQGHSEPYAECVPAPGAAVVGVRLTVVASTGGGVAAGGVADAAAFTRSRCSST